VPSTFHIENFGCRAARADGEAIAALLRASGAAESQPVEADVVIVNTCSVTAEADREARAYIRRAHRLNPAARIVATGCYAQRAPEELAGIPGVYAVIGNSHKALAPEIALRFADQMANVPREGSDSGDTDMLPTRHDSRVANVPAPVSGHDSGNPRTGSRAEGTAALKKALAPGGLSQIISIPMLLAASGNQPLIFADDTFAHSFLEEAPVIPGAQTRPNLKIQEGCSNRCSFCVIPQTRGFSRSLPGATVLSQVRNFVEAGGNELVLSGINLGRWGRDLATDENSTRSTGTGFSVEGTGFSPYSSNAVVREVLAPEGRGPRSLAVLVRAIFEQTGLPHLRLSSIEPMDWDSDLIALMAEYGGTRLARHAHLPLQSGSDAILRRMYRRYRPWHYTEKVAQLFSAAGPALTLGADVMVGFPGETDREFQETCDFIRSLPFGYLHLFPFSPRPGTRAWTLHNESPVAAAVVNERMAALRALASEKTRGHRRQFIGTELDAITLHTPPALASANCTSALTENFLPVELATTLDANQPVRIRVHGIATDSTLLASPVLSATSASDSQFCPVPFSEQPVLETTF
jgi:threonylcarbamoyladenosine tRNA methylthiotransferase MtaB